MKKLFGRDKPKMAKVTPAAREATTTVLPRETAEIEPEQTPHHSHRQAFPPHAQPQPQQPQQPQQQPLAPKRSGSLSAFDTRATERAGSGDERWEFIRAGGADSPALVESLVPPTQQTQVRHTPPVLTSSHSSLGSLPPGAAPGLVIPPRPESPYSTSSTREGRANSSTNHGASGGGKERTTSATLKKPSKSQQQQMMPPPGSATVALGILSSLNPHHHSPPPQSSPPANWDERADSTSVQHPREERKERWGFFSGDKRDKGKRKEEDAQAEITRMIGYLVATASEDWALVLELCERVSGNEAHAKEAAKALKREFKYAEPAAQLAAAKLWAIMVNNCSELFLDQCSSRKFLDTIEDLLISTRTSPVVRERVLDVLAGTTHASLTRKHDVKRTEKDPFQSLWKKVKIPGQPDQGIPFDTEDAMFNPPTPRRASVYSDLSSNTPLQPLRSPPLTNHESRPPNHHKSSRNRVIPVEEDIRRLFQECRVGRGNAALLGEALMYAKPQDLSKDIIREFFVKCQASQEFIHMQIPWATAGADRSREQKALMLSTLSENQQQQMPNELTVEEQLLAELLRANEEILEVLRMHDDLERIGIEREAEERSRREIRMDRTQIRYREADGNVYLEPPTPQNGGSSSRSSTPSTPGSSPAASISLHSSAPSTHPLPPIPSHGGQAPYASVPHMYTTQNGSPQKSSLVVPNVVQPSGLVQSQQQQYQQQNSAPHRFGPRSPAASMNRSRTPSPEPRRGASGHQFSNSVQIHGSQGGSGHYVQDSQGSQGYGVQHISQQGGSPQALRTVDVNGRVPVANDGMMAPVKPSAKALGKRKAAPAPERGADRFDPDDLFHDADHSERPEQESSESEVELLTGAPPKSTVNYAYDAVAERHKERVQAGKIAMLADLTITPQVVR